MDERDRTDDEVLLDEPFLLMTYSADAHLIHLEWKGHASSKQYRHGLELALEFIEDHSVRYWLADLRAMTAILKSDEKWANEVWFPKLFSTGLEKMAILRSRDYFNQTSVQRSFTAVSGRLTFKVAEFSTTKQAVQWLARHEAVSA